MVFPRKTKDKIRNLWFPQGKPKKRYVTVGFPKENQRKDIVSAEGWMVCLICLREGLRGPTLACARRRADQGIPGRAATASPLGKKAHARPRTPGEGPVSLPKGCRTGQGIRGRALTPKPLGETTSTRPRTPGERPVSLPEGRWADKGIPRGAATASP